jgi:hypothetical protein
MSVGMFDGEKHGTLDPPLMQNRVDALLHQLSPPNKIAFITEPLFGQVSLMAWQPEHS